MEPTIEMDLYGEKPFALSPALAALNYVSLSREEINGLTVNEHSLGILREMYKGGM